MAKSKMMKIQPKSNSEAIHALLYARVSTDKQAEEGYSIAIQQARLAAHVTSVFGTENVTSEFFIDDGYSGASLDRPEMQRMIDTIKAGRGTHVIVVKLDRLSRSQKDTLYLIEDIFLMHNVDFVSIQESFNTSTAFGRAMVGILSVFAQLERENIFERTRSGMQARVASGLWPGGGRVPFGYDYDQQQGILVPNKDADTVRKVYDLYLRGKSPQTIANMLGLKYDRLAYQILVRKSNTGVIVYNGVEYPGKHEAIISTEIYEEAMRAMKSRERGSSGPATYHLLTGLVYCGHCGARMRYIKWGNEGYRLMCYSRQKNKPYMVKDPECPSKYYPADKVEEAVLQNMKEAKRIGWPSDAPPDAPAMTDLEMLQARYDRLAAKLRRLYNLYSEAEDEVLRETIEKVKTEMEELRQQIHQEESEDGLVTQIQRGEEDIQDIIDSWPYLDDTERHTALCSIIDSVVLEGPNITVNYKF